MPIWREFPGWTYEYFDSDVKPESLPGFEGLLSLWKEKRGDRAVPAWSDFDFADFKRWHSRIAVYEIYYDPFDYSCRLSVSVRKVLESFESHAILSRIASRFTNGGRS